MPYQAGYEHKGCGPINRIRGGSSWSESRGLLYSPWYGKLELNVRRVRLRLRQQQPWYGMVWYGMVWYGMAMRIYVYVLVTT